MASKVSLFNSLEWPRKNFSLQLQYNTKQRSDENKEKYQSGDYKLIQYQVLQTNIIHGSNANFNFLFFSLLFFLLAVGSGKLSIKYIYFFKVVSLSSVNMKATLEVKAGELI